MVHLLQMMVPIAKKDRSHAAVAIVF